MTVWQVPPPTQGLVALMALNLLEADAQYLSKHLPGSTEHVHSAIESLRLAFADALACNCDPLVVPMPLGDMLDKERATKRRKEYFSPDKVRNLIFSG